MASAADSPGRIPRLAARAVLVASVCLAVVEVGRVGLSGSTADILVALAVTAVYLPLHLWHLRYGLRGERPPRSGATLAVMAVAHAVALLVIGPAWSFALAALATSALVVLRPRWALAALVACACGPILAVSLRPDPAVTASAATSYFVFSVVYRSVLQFALVWLVAAVHQLDASRAAVAAAAAELERERLEAEVRASLQQRSAALADAARRARAALDGPGVAAALVALDRVVALSRQALVDLRRIVADARRPVSHQAADALVRGARDARTPVGRTLVARQAWPLVAAVHGVVVTFLLLAQTDAFFESVPGYSTALAVALLTVALVLFLSLSVDVARGRRPRYGVARWLALVGVYVAGLALVDPFAWAATDWLVGAGALMVFAGRRAWLAVGLAATWFVAWNTKLVFDYYSADITAYDFVWDFAYTTTLLALSVLGLYASARLVPVVAGLHAARDELAAGAARSERRRLSGDLHDVLGQSLTAISLKGDLASRLVARDRTAAATELDELLALALGQDGELAAVTRDERKVIFDVEAANAVALLRSAGVKVDADVDLGELDEGTSTLLGWAVREGATNILRHATASTCSIRARRDGAQVRLELTNDGVTGRAERGTGLTALGDRFAEHGGTAESAALSGGRFLLSVALPAPAPVPA